MTLTKDQIETLTEFSPNEMLLKSCEGAGYSPVSTFYLFAMREHAKHGYVEEKGFAHFVLTPKGQTTIEDFYCHTCDKPKTSCSEGKCCAECSHWRSTGKWHKHGVER